MNKEVRRRKPGMQQEMNHIKGHHRFRGEGGGGGGILFRGNAVKEEDGEGEGERP